MKLGKHMLSNIDQLILEIVKMKQPNTVKELVQLVQGEFLISEDDVIKHIVDLSSEGKLKFIEYSFPSTSKSYIFSIKAAWYWAFIAVAVATTVTVFTVPEDAYPIVCVRYIFGSIFVLFLPGYSLIKVLLPMRELDDIERAALSIGISLAFVPIVGLFLNYTPWGITTTTVTLSLLTLITIFATAAIMQEQQAESKRKPTAISKMSNCK
jgi:hypothetical protein